MNIPLANPNTTEAMTARAAARGVTITAPWSFAYISALAEAQIVGAICPEMLAASPPPGAGFGGHHRRHCLRLCGLDPARVTGWGQVFGLMAGTAMQLLPE